MADTSLGSYADPCADCGKSPTSHCHWGHLSQSRRGYFCSSCINKRAEAFATGFPLWGFGEGLNYVLVRAICAASPSDILARDIQPHMSLYGDPLKIGRVVGSAEFLELLDKLQRETGIAVPANLLPSESQLHSILVQDVLELFRELKALVPAA